MITKIIKTHLNSEQLFLLFSDEKNIMFLDSGGKDKKLGEFSFIVFDPFIKFNSKDKNINILDKNIIGNPLEELQNILDKYKIENKGEFPFNGGAVGYLSYDLARQIEILPRTTIDDVQIEDIVMYFYHGAIVVDHIHDKIYYSDYNIDGNGQIRFDYVLDKINKSLNIIKPEVKYNSNSKIVSNFTKNEYLSSIKKIKEYIISGDIYQANMTQRFCSEFDGNAIGLYLKLREKNPAPFSGYLDIDDVKILSSSPERFVKVRDRIITTRPIKGTMPRGVTVEEDEKNKNILINSEKDKAELLMIVDLERNDLGRISEIGSVKVKELFELETYATVFHLVSTIEAKLRDDINFKKLIEGIFPGGSITGAPKIRAMEIIDELEPTQRNIYTGSLGYIDFAGDIDINIVIRTIVLKDNKAYIQLGGGIVLDSVEELEYEETLHKGKALFEVLEGWCYGRHYKIIRIQLWDKCIWNY